MCKALVHDSHPYYYDSWNARLWPSSPLRTFVRVLVPMCKALVHDSHPYYYDSWNARLWPSSPLRTFVRVLVPMCKALVHDPRLPCSRKTCKHCYCGCD